MSGRWRIISLAGCLLLLVLMAGSCAWLTTFPTSTTTPPSTPTFIPPEIQKPERSIPSTETPTLPSTTSPTPEVTETVELTAILYQGGFDIIASTISYISVGFGDAMLLSVHVIVPFEITLTEAYEGGPLTGETEGNMKA